MEFNEIYKKAKETTKNRLKRANAEPDINQTIIHLLEELGEVAFQRNNELIRKENSSQKNMGEEIADCVILLMFLASQYDLNLEDEIIKKIKDISLK